MKCENFHQLQTAMISREPCEGNCRSSKSENYSDGLQPSE